MPKRPPVTPKQGLTIVTRKGRPGLYLRGTVRGTTVFESAGTSDPILAEEARSAREAELYRLAIHGPKPEAKPSVTFAAAAASYLTTKTHSDNTKIRVGRLLDHFGPKVACDAVKQTEVDRACAALCRPNAQPATKLREVVGPIKAILTHAAMRGWCPRPMFERMKGAKKRTDWFTPAEAEALIGAAAAHLKPLLVFMFCTGCRLNEALTLQWAAVDLQHGRATFIGERDSDGLGGTKNGLDRIASLPPRAVAALASMPHKTGRVFRDRSGRDYRDTNDAERSYGGQIKTAWATAMRSAGIARDLTPHHTRHSFATWHYAVHQNPIRLREDGGWSSISQVERYAKLAPDGMKDDIDAFWGICAISVPTKTEGRLSA
jgi:integrase